MKSKRLYGWTRGSSSTLSAEKIKESWGRDSGSAAAEIEPIILVPQPFRVS